jgi:hypothetical protein
MVPVVTASGVTASFCVACSVFVLLDDEGDGDGLGVLVADALGDALGEGSGDEDGDGAGVPVDWESEPVELVPSSAIAAGMYPVNINAPESSVAIPPAYQRLRRTSLR